MICGRKNVVCGYSGCEGASRRSAPTTISLVTNLLTIKSPVWRLLSNGNARPPLKGASRRSAPTRFRVICEICIFYFNLLAYLFLARGSPRRCAPTTVTCVNRGIRSLHVCNTLKISVVLICYISSQKRNNFSGMFMKRRF